MHKRKMKYQDNKGKYCSVSGYNKKARVKGLCTDCYNIQERKRRINENSWKEI
jgi:hypothetical protein